MLDTRRTLLKAVAAMPLGALMPRVHAQGTPLVRVANGTTPDILSLPDVRAIEHFLPMQAKARGKATYVPGAVRAIQAVITGEAEVGIATLASGLNAVLQNQDLRVFCLASGARPYLVPLATKNITNLKALEGQEVGVISLVDSTYYLLVMMMRARGADPSKVKWRVVGGGAGRANAILSGGVKAAMFQVGQALELISKGDFAIMPISYEGLKNIIFKAFWARNDFLQKQPGLAQAVVQAHLLATREALDKAQFMRYAPSALAPMTPAVISQSYDLLLKTGPWDPNDALLNRTAGEFTVSEMVRYGVIKQSVPFDRWVTTKFVHAAVAKLGAAK